jgi:hypothetical protein
MAKRSIGNMRESVVFLANNPIPAAGGGFADVYTTLLTTRGQLFEAGDSRSLSFGAIADNSSMRLICRFQTALAANLRSDTKIIISGITYTMNGQPVLIDQKKHFYEFKIQAQTN